MLISPLMGPIMAAGLALAVADFYLGIKALLSLVISITVAIFFSAFLVWLLPFHSATAEILARTNPNLLDLGVALFSGLAGAVALSRSGDGNGMAALPGVAIAVALMPPLCAMGFGFGSGGNLEIVAGAGLLFLTNLVAIVASAFVIFLLVGMNSPEVHTLARSCREGDPLAALLPRTLTNPAPDGVIGGQLRWRILLLLVILASITVPLRKALLQVASEAVARGTVEEEIKRLIPGTALVSRQVHVASQEIAIELISTQPVAAAKIETARTAIARRTGREVRLTVQAVASRSELTLLMDRLRMPAPAPPERPNLMAIQKDVMERVRPAIDEIWPADQLPLEDASLAFTATGPVIQIRYQGAADLGEVPEEMLLKNLRAKLGTPSLGLNLERIPLRTTKKVSKHASKR